MSRTKELLEEEFNYNNEIGVDEEMQRRNDIEEEQHYAEYQEKVRGRKSYKDFKDLLLTINKGNETDVLRFVFNLIDFKRGFGSKTNSVYAEESLQLLIKDTGLEEGILSPYTNCHSCKIEIKKEQSHELSGYWFCDNCISKWRYIEGG